MNPVGRQSKPWATTIWRKPTIVCSARVQAVLIPELTAADRRRVIEELNAEFEQNKALVGAAWLRGGRNPTPAQGTPRAIYADEALKEGEPTLDTVLRSADSTRTTKHGIVHCDDPFPRK